ncbi:hypothetical protein SDRG_17335 [Saprolegnia diclina VS20]|uniref:Uncharacterized protein n=1 Tax=Saprolegnia diclina (strain VS20) TaxID=1156394 RepID=T0PUT9_SAPDV|nr:hypothetical protein SDRG_17335 [Saprolegnia diclina VS20]EQC24775.1 hypothetical protein SDRG_17335 [Saprolegnia diclina VS20]|eukprot:XP_008621798.1 hypothetical protein SDRG_17335 [Saprolegnia diclina VS20]
MSELYERVNYENYSGCFVGHSIRRFPGPFLDTLLARDDTKGVALLQRFGPSPDDFPGPQNQQDDKTPEKVRQAAIQAATLENATLALDMLPWLQYPALFDDIAGRGFLPLVRSLHERGVNCSTDAMNKAAANGHLEVVRFLHEHRSEGCTTVAMDDAATNGHLEVVQFLHENRTEGCTHLALNFAIVNGRLNVVRFLIEHRTESAWDGCIGRAAGNGHLEVLQYLHSLGSYRWSNSTVERASAGGHLEIVQFLLANRTEERASDLTLRNALTHGHYATAKYLVSRGCTCATASVDWDWSTFGKPEIIDVLRLFMDLGGPYDAKWMREACAKNNVPLARFLDEVAGNCNHGPPLRDAMSHKAWDAVRYLLAHLTTNVSVDELKQVLSSGQFDIATLILRRQPLIGKNKYLLGWLATNHYTEATRYLLAAGIGNPRNKLLLPHCMHAIDHLDNVSFLLDLLALPDRRRKTTLQLITHELLDQGRQASQTIALPTDVAARASTLLEAGAVVDWSLALLISHLHATDATATTKQLKIKAALIEDAELKALLDRLLVSKRKR